MRYPEALMKSILLVGAGGHAKACIDVIETEGRFRIGGLVDKEADTSKSILGYPIIGDDAELEALRSDYDFAFVAIGQIRSPNPRIQAYDALRALNFTVPAIVSPLAHVSSHARVADGTIIMHGAIVNAATSIGRNCIINSRALIEHDVTVGDHCHVATAATINGSVIIEDGVFIGSGATTTQGVTIGERCIVGARTLVRRDLSADTVYTG
jgi:sugar O-acyltransferase (sialic acid O-acetyltransferase NeuD family)